MALSKTVPPLEYLREAFPASLESFELSRLNHAANLRREIAALIDQWIEEQSEALLARWLLDHRHSLRTPPLAMPNPFQSFLEPALPPRPNSHPPPADIVPAPPRFADSRPALNRPIDRKPQKHRSTA